MAPAVHTFGSARLRLGFSLCLPFGPDARVRNDGQSLERDRLTGLVILTERLWRCRQWSSAASISASSCDIRVPIASSTSSAAAAALPATDDRGAPAVQDSTLPNLQSRVHERDPRSSPAGCRRNSRCCLHSVARFVPSPSGDHRQRIVCCRPLSCVSNFSPHTGPSSRQAEVWIGNSIGVGRVSGEHTARSPTPRGPAGARRPARRPPLRLFGRLDGVARRHPVRGRIGRLGGTDAHTERPRA